MVALEITYIPIALIQTYCNRRMRRSLLPFVSHLTVVLTLFTAYPVYTIRASLLLILNVNAVVSVVLVVSVAFRQHRLHTFNTVVLIVYKCTVEGNDSTGQNILNYGLFVGAKDLSLIPHLSH